MVTKYKQTMRHIYVSIFAFLLFFQTSYAQKDETIREVEKEYTYEIVTNALEIPWGIDFLPDGSIIATEKEGGMFLIKDGNLQEIADVPQVKVMGQGGLLDIKLHPNFEANNWLYISYAESRENGKANTRLIRAKLVNNSLTDIIEIYKGAPETNKPYHFGSRIEFDNEGYLYFSIGDRGNRDENPQDITRDGGKIYRFHDDGTIPSDNPFVNEAGAKKGIFSYGHRNPQGMEMHPETGKIWIHEHGPKGGDEINIIQKGKNYGWPVISYGINYDGTIFTELTNKEGMEQPIYAWIPSIAPSGMTFVTSDKYPELKGNLLVGALKFAYLEHCVLEGEKVIKRERLLKNVGRIRSVKQAPDGFIYVGVEGLGIIKMLPKS